jgi:hypothetical protein
MLSGPPPPQPDSIAWHYEKSGVFSVRSAYRLALTRALNLEEEGSSTAPRGDRAVWKKLWNLPIPPKVRNFLWKLVKNGLPTNENRRYRHLTSDGSCEMCSYKMENGFHAVIDCPHAKSLRCANKKTRGTMVAWDEPWLRLLADGLCVI